MSDSKKLPSQSSSSDIQAFLKKLTQTPNVKPAGRKGRLVFALDATASREPTWQEARRIQSEMFDAAAALGGLEIQLCFYRGIADFEAFPWLIRAEELRRRMADVECVGGYTQIGKVLEHALQETRKSKVDALVFVGDSMEENVDYLCKAAGELGILGMRAFLFQEGFDPTAELAFKQVAKLTQGAHCRFDAGSARQLRDLLSAVAVYAAGGLKALENFGRTRGGVVLQLTHQMAKP
ncbi:hypothetical protein [Methylocaldum sp.]|uniref:hypothetical protein n=1 Tax=Methylocaldum sp. TaxID=1969727 RepID=UPI002D60D0A8|nr:hypothetical protein [Methylocaldum sp.]HYE33906.1 hypothetical protein [Methylocaldum sp.]